MLLKFNAIEEIGRFAALTHKAEPFSRLSLIFARNGYGKSTLCSILRSASEENPKYIQARRRLGATRESRVQSSWTADRTVAFGGGKWNCRPGKVYIFDQEFVQQNVHLGDSVTRENKRRLLPVVLGLKGVELAQKIVDLDREQRDLDATMRARAEIIHAKCPVVSATDLSSFCVKDIPDDISERIETASQAFQLASQAAVVKIKVLPVPLPLKTTAYYLNILTRTLENASEDAAARVQVQLEKHDLGVRGRKWLEYGTDHSGGDGCPYCDQPIRGLALLDAYRAYFSQAFAQLTADYDEALAEVQKILTDNSLSKIGDAHAIDFSFWRQVCELREIPSLSVSDREIIRAGLVELERLLKLKASNPLRVVDTSAAMPSIEGALALVAQYNRLLEHCVAVMVQAQQSAIASDVALAQQTQQKWMALAAKSSEPVNSAAQDYTGADSRKRAIEVEKPLAQNELRNYADGTMRARQIEVNALLADFGASFEIVDAKASFVGRDPNTEWAVAVGGKKIKAGDQSDTEPSFKTVLSTGDKTTLALAFFIAQVRADSGIGDAVVVFDDPFNSQDMSRQFETTSQIRAISKVACQTIVLSHDPRFLAMIEKDGESAVTRTYQLTCTDSGYGTVGLWSSKEELKALYVRQAEVIREYASQGTLLRDASVNDIVKSIRPFLEDYIRARYPGRFQNGEMIVAMCEAINAAGGADALFGTIADLLALNEYSRVNMHGGGSTPDPVALRAQCRRIVRIVGAY